MSNMYKKYLEKAKKQKPKEDPKAKLAMFKKYANGSSGVGMGDVKAADASNNTLPVLQQGYGSEDNDKVAQMLSKIEAKVQGKNPGTQSPEDVKNTANAIALAAPNELGVVEEGANAGKDALEASDALDTTNDATEGVVQKFRQFLNMQNKAKLPAAGTSGGLSAAEQAALKPNYSIPQEQVANNLSKPPVMLQDSSAPIPGPQFKNQGGMIRHYDLGGSVNTATSLSPMMKNTYAGPQKFANGGQVQESQQQRYQAKDYFGKDDGSDSGETLGRFANGTNDAEKDDTKQSPEEAAIEYAESKKRQLEKDLLNSTKSKEHEPENAVEYNNPDKFPGTKRPMTNMEANNPSKYDDGTSAVQSAQDSMRKAFNFARGTAHVPEHEAYHKYMALFGGLPKVPKIPANPLANVKAPAEVKVPLNIERAPHLKIPKRLKPISQIKGYDEGTDDAEKDDKKEDKKKSAERVVDDSNDAMIQKYRKLGMLKGPTVATDDEADVTASPTPQVQAPAAPPVAPQQPADQGPYPGEEEAGQDTVDNTAQGQVQKLIDDHDQSQDVLQKIDAALGKPQASDPTKYPKIRNLPGMTLHKDEALAENPEDDKDKDLEDQYKKEEDKADDAANLDGDEKSPEDNKPESEDEEQPKKKQADSDDENNPAKKLLQAQKDQKQAILLNQLGKISDKFAGRFGHFQPQNQDIYDENIKNADLPVKQLEQQIAMEKYDPNSATSQSFRQYLAKFGGQDVKDLGNISAAQAEAIAPMAFKQFEAQQAQQARSNDMANRTAERLQQTKLMVDQREAASKQHSDDLRFLAAEKAEAGATSKKEKDQANLEKQQATVAKNVDQSLYGFRQPPDVKQARMDFLNANKGLNTIAAYEKMPGGTDSMDINMVGNLRDEVQKIAQSGAPTEGGINKFDPKTWSGDLAAAWQKVSNKPTGANAGAFIKKYKDYFNTMQETTGGLVNSYNNSILKNNKKHMDPDDYDDRANSEYVAPYSKYNKAPKADASSKQPSQANDAATAPQKTIVKKGYNAKTDQTQLIYDDGTKEIVNGRQ